MLNFGSSRRRVPSKADRTGLARFEVTVLATQALIDVLAERIEKAYRLRRPLWNGYCSSSRVWSVAAAMLWSAHETDPVVPADPELFVAAQPRTTPYQGPWEDLASHEAVRAYADQVRSIIVVLRDELSAEVRLAEMRIAAGKPIIEVLNSPSRRLSPLARFIVAHRSGRKALADRYAEAAAQQHGSCPLYRQASMELLPPGVYPNTEIRVALTASSMPRRPRFEAHLN